jgi:hypothetical protein
MEDFEIAHALKPLSTSSRPSGLEFAHPPGYGMIRTTSQALFRGALEIHIQHDGVLYRLRKTSLGKLILTK